MGSQDMRACIGETAAELEETFSRLKASLHDLAREEERLFRAEAEVDLARERAAGDDAHPAVREALAAREHARKGLAAAADISRQNTEEHIEACYVLHSCLYFMDRNGV